MHSCYEKIHSLYLEFNKLIEVQTQKCEQYMLEEHPYFATKLRKHINVMSTSQKMVTDTFNVYGGKA
jgi:hypothetical protein